MSGRRLAALAASPGSGAKALSPEKEKAARGLPFIGLSIALHDGDVIARPRPDISWP
jgi:hypothetical protein